MKDPDRGEAARLAALRRYDILDTPPEAGFDDVVRLASRLCAAPTALVSFVTADRQWFKARIGFPDRETDLDRSVCAHVLTEPDLLVIPDLTRDARTRANPLVTGEPRIRFYAGAPLRTPDGHTLGSLCVIDRQPRPEGLTPEQADDLRALARQVMGLIQLRASEARLTTSEAYWRGLFERLSEGFLVGEVVRDAQGRVVDWRYVDVNAVWGELVGLDPGEAVGRTVREVFPGIEDAWIDEFAGVVETGEVIAFTRQVAGAGRWYEGSCFRLSSERFAVIFLEITARLASEARRAALLAVGDRLSELGTVSEMIGDVSAIVGRALGVTRAGFGRLDAAAEYVEIESDWTLEGVASIAGRHRFADDGDIARELLRGEALVVADVATDRRTAADPGPLLALDIGAFVNVPVRERGRTVAVFIVQDRRPRTWSPEVLTFLRSVADRLEAAVARAHAEAQQEVLNQELSHRLKNTLAMVQAIAAQTLRAVPERGPVETFEQRLHALATAHEVLLRPDGASGRMGAVIRAVLGNFDAARFDVSGPDVELGPRATLSLSLLLHELATNAAKYGALSGETGRVGVAWRVEGEDAVLRWEETGGPPAREPTSRGFGTRLIGMGLVGTGGVELRYPPSGFRAEMRAPLAQLQWS